MTLRSLVLGSLVAASLAGCRKDNPVGAELPPLAPRAASVPAVGDLRKVGRVDFPISCAGQQGRFDRAMALLHSFFYVEARRQFAELTRDSPGCAIAHWGVAMTWYHPLWAPPVPDEMAQGRAALEAAKVAATKSPRERGFIDALGAFYADGTGPTPGEPAAVGMGCHGPTGGDHVGRAVAYANAMGALHAANPGDDEVSSLYALALLGSAKPVDPTLENQRKAAAILEQLWAARRDHPGVAHYLIHSYDFPPLAEKGLVAARAYADLAPWVPHALHMPSHIFVRLGMWPESIESNVASAAAARNYGQEQGADGTTFDELHALDYLVYAFLQTGQDDKAKAIVDRVSAVRKTAPEVDFAASYAVGAVPARYAVERHAWAEAAALPTPDMSFWKKFPFAEAHLEYARGLGRARSGDAAGAQQSLVRLAELREATNDPKFVYFKQHLALQHQAVTAWVAHTKGDTAGALAALRRAAQQEGELGKSPVSPGPIDLIYEQLGDLLSQQKKHADALAAYETALKTSPGRLNSLLGAAMALEQQGKLAEARAYYGRAIEQTKGGTNSRPELEHARAFLAR